MNMIKKIFIISVVFLTYAYSVSASRIKYDDVYKAVLSGDKEKAYTLLLAYQKQNPKFANAYFQLGMIAKEWALDFNPYTDFEYTKLFIYNTKLYFSLAKLYMKDEKNKNRSYYKNAPIIPKGKKLKIEDIEDYINSQTEQIKDYEKHVTVIINYYNKSSNYYNNCVKTFMEINTEYAKIKNIYLSDDPKLEKNMKKLVADFDSALYNFKMYKKALKEYPLNRYNQNYILKDIVTYRLDGLTYSGFLNNEIQLWNYKKWVNEVYEVKEKIINTNRKDILNQNNIIKQKINELENGEYSDDYPKFKLDEKFVYKIEKFDNNSLLIKLFKLNEAKINFLVKFKKEINNPAKITEFPILKRSIYCYDLIKTAQKTDSINTIFEEAIKPEQVKKYKNFYVSVYGGMKGLKEYSFRQRLYLDSKIKESLINLKKHLYNTEFKINTESLKYGDTTEIITEKTFPGNKNLETEKYYITDFKKNNKNTLWICGFKTSVSGNVQAFTGYTNDKKNLDFLSVSEKNDSCRTYNLFSAPFPEGCYIIQTKIYDDKIKNILLKYDNKGKIISKENLPYDKIPRLLKYDDINNIIFIVFNGKTFEKINNDKEQIIWHYKPDDQLQTYEVTLNAKADIFDMIKKDNKLYIFGNFISYEDLSGKTVNSKAGTSDDQTNIFMSVISNGMITKQIPLLNPKPFFGVKALKLNSNTFNIIGYKTNFTQSNFADLKLKELFYEIINPDGKEIYSAWHD